MEEYFSCPDFPENKVRIEERVFLSDIPRAQKEDGYNRIKEHIVFF
jgi:hypothetical protein